MRRLLSAALSVGAVLLGTTMLSLPPAAATTWSDGYCPTSKGVTVVADFRALGGGVEIRCYASATSSTTGVEALQGAGFNPTGTQQYGLAFVCTIQNQPDTTCPSTPPANSYWSYWKAPNAGSWSYSTVGAASSNVIPGGFEGWSFYKGPSNGQASPPEAKATRPPPVVKPTFHMGPAASLTAKPKPSHSTSPTSKPTTTTASPTTSATPTGTATTPDGTSTSSEAQAGGALPGDGPSGGSSPWPFVLGIGAVALIGGGAFLVVQRRRVGGF